jgi:hypothetical protein
MLAPLVCPVHFGHAHAADKPAARTFDADGVKLSYFVQGKGEPVVLIHGWLSAAGINWALPGTSALLAKDYRKLYVEPLRRVRKDRPVVEIKDANHITCILKRQFREGIAAWLKKNAR